LAKPCVEYPASDPNVVAVGGVTGPLDNWGNLERGSQFTAWGQQTTGGGNGNFNNNIGSGGGTSVIFPAMPWQKSNINAAMREVPDLALMGDPNTGPSLLQYSFDPNAYLLFPVGGTSVSAPEMAAMWALVLQACKQTPACASAGGTHPYRLGNPGPLIYAIYGTVYDKAATGPSSFTPQLSYNQVFFDVIYGDNAALPPAVGPTPLPPNATPIPGCCLAGPGYDQVTGVGVPFGGHLIQAITGKSVP
jgi:subtilase family serine protease